MGSLPTGSEPAVGCLRSPDGRLYDGNDLAAISREIAVATSNHSESVRALLAMNEQQAASNVRLDALRGETNLNLRAIRDELHALNEKASVAGNVEPPQNAQP